MDSVAAASPTAKSGSWPFESVVPPLLDAFQAPFASQVTFAAAMTPPQN